MNTLIILYLISIPIPLIVRIVYSKRQTQRFLNFIQFTTFLPYINTCLSIALILNISFDWIEWYFKRRRLLKKYEDVNFIALIKTLGHLDIEGKILLMDELKCNRRAYNRLKFGYRSKSK